MHPCLILHASHPVLASAYPPHEPPSLLHIHTLLHPTPPTPPTQALHHLTRPHGLDKDCLPRRGHPLRQLQRHERASSNLQRSCRECSPTYGPFSLLPLLAAPSSLVLPRCSLPRDPFHLLTTPQGSPHLSPSYSPNTSLLLTLYSPPISPHSLSPPPISHRALRVPSLWQLAMAGLATQNSCAQCHIKMHSDRRRPATALITTASSAPHCSKQRSG